MKSPALTLLAALTYLSAVGAQTSQLVSLGAQAKLVYAPANARGDVIPDFSNCGYRGGGVALPNVPKITMAPDTDGMDDLPRLQNAVDAMSQLPLQPSGFRGALLLKKGRYFLGNTLKIGNSGVVLRGEGDGEDGTVLVATLPKQHNLIQIGGVGKIGEMPGSRQAILDAIVPVGARVVRVQNPERFQVGQDIVVERPSTAAWIAALGMDRIPMAADNKTVQWAPGSKDLHFERTITAIQGQQLFFDAPLVNAFEKQYGSGSVYRSEFPGRIQNVGIENLRGESLFSKSIRDPSKKDQPADENHGWNFISFGAARDGWVRNVTSRYFGYSCVNIGASARSLTVQDSRCLDPVSRVIGGRRYSFAIAGQLNLVQRCFASNGRHDFVMHAVVPGPNVFLDCHAVKAYTDSGPHHRWATGTLYDNLKTNGPLNVQNRGNSGTGHGWAGSQMVFWNCQAGSIDLQKPPTSQNYAIGCIAAKTSGNGYWESVGVPVAPRSLYLQQLEDRLGKQAVANIEAPANR